MHNISYTSATDRELLQHLGERLEALRGARGFTQAEAARRAGLGRNTLYRAEQGKNPTIVTVIRLLRIYGRLAALDGFIPAPEISPMARLRERKGKQDGGQP